MLIDFDKNIPKAKDYMYDSIRFTDDGSKLAADLLAESIANIYK